MKVIGVDEHVWRHTRPVRDGAGPASLLDMVEGRSKAAFKTWLADRDDAFRDAVDRCRRRVQLAIHGHRGFRDDPLYKSRRTLRSGADLFTDTQSDRLRALFVDDATEALNGRLEPARWGKKRKEWRREKGNSGDLLYFLFGLW